MKKYLQYIILSVVFFIPVFGIIFTPNDYVVKNENRMIQQFPKWEGSRGQKDKVYFSNLINYFDDRLLYKIKLSENFYKDYQRFFHNFIESTKRFAIDGLEGWTFLGDDLAYVYSKHSDPKFSYNFEEQRNLEKKVKFLKTIEERFGVKPYVIVGPDKHAIYHEYMLPYLKHPGTVRAFEKLKAYFKDNDINIIDNYDVLLKAKEKLNWKTLQI